MTDSPGGELTGFTVAVTAARRAQEFETLLARRGAAVRSAAAIAMVPLHDDQTLRRVTDELVADPPDVLIATTAIGFRGWIEAADGWGRADDLLDVLRGARLISRGPKPTGALRAAGLREEWSPASESTAEVLEHLRSGRLGGERLDGLRVAVQLHGASDDWDPNPGFLSGLAELGAEVIEVPVYRWKSPDDPAALDALIGEIVTGGVDAVTFTSAPAVASVLMRAAELGLEASLHAAVTGRVVVYCVGPVTAAPLDRLGVPSVAPDRMRLGALARLVADDLPQRRPELSVAGHRLGVRARAAVVDGQLREVSATGMALLKALADRPGEVRSREELLALLPAAGDDPHAVEVAIGRLRTALGVRELIATVVKRGYRLAV